MKKASYTLTPLALSGLIVLAVMLMLGAYAVTGYATSSTTGITLCTDTNFKGDCRTFIESVPVIKDVFGAGKGISSVQAPSSGIKDIYFLCARDQYRFPCRNVQNTDYDNLEKLKFTLYGRVCTLNKQLVPGCWIEGEGAFTGKFNDNVRSLIVAPWVTSKDNAGSYEPPFPIFCTEKNMVGECLRVKSSLSGLNSFEVKTAGEINKLAGKPEWGDYYFDFNDKFTSMIVPSGWTVTAYSAPDYTGNRYVVKGPAYLPDFSLYRGMKGTISSIQLVGARPVAVTAPGGIGNATVSQAADTEHPEITDAYAVPNEPHHSELLSIVGCAIDHESHVSNIKIYFGDAKEIVLSKTCDINSISGCCIYSWYPPAGSYRYYVSATDDSGNTGKTGTKDITVLPGAARKDGKIPTVSVTSKANSDGTVTIEATASDETLLYSILLYIDNAENPSYVCTYTEKSGVCTYTTRFAPGKHSYVAVAYDAAGNSNRDPFGMSEMKYFEAKDMTPPTIEKVYTDPETVYANQPFSLVAEVSDNVKVANIDMWVDNVKKTCAINAERGRCDYSFPNGKTAGSHTYLVQVIDRSGTTARTTPGGKPLATITVKPATAAGTTKDTTIPSVSVAMNNKNTGKVSDCVIEASASDDRVLRRLEIYVNGQLKAYNDFSAVSTGKTTYTENFGWQPGTYKYYAMAFDLYNNGARTTEKSFIVDDSNNKNCLYVESTCPSGQTKDIKTGVCKPNLGGGGQGGIFNLLGGFVQSVTAQIAAAFG
jgi:hypothetical protein